MKRALLLAPLLLATASRGAEIRVAAAASLTDALEEIAPAYERATGDTVVFNFGASSLLARQIEEGFPADLFFSADEEKMDALETRGLVAAGTRRSLLSNTLVVVVAADRPGTLRSMKDLAGDEWKALALAEPATVPAGIYAKKHLEAIGIWPRVARRVVPTENVRAALAAVESGNVDAGIVYKTDALVGRRVRVAYELPRSEGPDISYPVAILRASTSPAAAGRLLDFLGSERALAVFLRRGFVVRKAAR